MNDFSVLKEKFQGWIEDNWYHGFIYWGRKYPRVGYGGWFNT
jgi:hypothetical protein